MFFAISAGRLPTTRLDRLKNLTQPLARLISQHQDDGAYQIAQVYGYRGEVDQAFASLNRACKQSDPGLMWLKTDLKLKSLPRDPRYTQLLKRLNLPEQVVRPFQQLFHAL